METTAQMRLIITFHRAAPYSENYARNTKFICRELETVSGKFADVMEAKYGRIYLINKVKYVFIMQNTISQFYYISIMLYNK